MRISLFQTTTFRFMMFASLAFIAAGCAVLGFLYLSMLFTIDGQIRAALSRDFADLTSAYEKGGYARLQETVAGRASPDKDALRLYLLRSPDGTLTGNLPQWPRDAPEPGPPADIEVIHDAKPARVRTLAFAGGIRLLVGRSLSERSNLQNIARQSLLSVLAANLLLGLAAGILLARYARRRLDKINAIAGEVLQGNLSVRAAVREGGDEYDHLSQNFNTMLDRVEQLVATVRGVTENIAHDLRTPLTRLRGRLEVALMSPRSPESYRNVLSRAIADSEIIVETFNALLRIARMKAGALSMPQQKVDIAEVAAEIACLYEVIAAESGISVEVRFPNGDQAEEAVHVLGDPHLISQAAANLLDNAIKYSPQGGKIVIAATRMPDGTSLTVADNGPGIPADKRAAILDRFVRLEAATGKQGFGLGLNFVAAVAEWHGATLELTDNSPGLCAALHFPACKLA